MQRVSNRMGYTIDEMYSSGGTISNWRIDANQLNYELNNPFQRFFRVILRGNHVEIPVFARNVIQSRLSMILLPNSNTLREDIIIPFPCVGVGNECRTADTIVRYLTGSASTRQNMCFYADTNKGERYYGCNGTLFNKDMVPIFLNVLVGDIGNYTLTYNKIRTYIHPSVFYSEGIVEKCIINKIIPYVMQNGVNAGVGVTNNIHCTINKDNKGRYQRAIPEIVVVDIGDRFFCKPILPSVLYTNDSINDALNENIDDVFNIMGI